MSALPPTDSLAEWLLRHRDAASGAAVGSQLVHGLRDAILQAVMQPGQRLPSSRALADRIGVARNTVVAAYTQLQAEGFVVAGHGSGTYVRPVVQERGAIPAAPARGATAVAHRLSHVDVLDLLDGIVLAEKPVEHATRTRVLLAVTRGKQEHRPRLAGQAQDLGVEEVALRGLLEGELFLPDTERQEWLGTRTRCQHGAELAEDTIGFIERLVVIEQDVFVPHRDDIVVKCAGIDRLVALPREDDSFWIETMTPGDRL